MLKTAVLVSGGGSNLQAILDAEKRGEICSARIGLVVSNKEGAYALERARKAQVEALSLVKAPDEKLQDYGLRLLSLLRSRGIELVVLAGFLLILPPNVIEAYPERILNIHPSLIPSFCGKGFYGLKVHEAALQAGVKLTGATVHLVNEIPDGGRILMQKAVEVRPDDTAEGLQLRVMQEAEWILLPKALEIRAKQILEENNA